MTSTTCEERNFLDPLLTSWGDSKKVYNFIPTQVKMAPPFVAITCDEKNLITINGNTTHCCPFTFTSSINDHFNMSDYKYQPQIHKKFFSSEIGIIPPPLVLTNISPHRAQMDSINQLSEQNNKLCNSNWHLKPFDSFDYAPSYEVLIVCIAFVGLSIILGITIYCLVNKQSRASAQQIPLYSRPMKHFNVSTG